MGGNPGVGGGICPIAVTVSAPSTVTFITPLAKTEPLTVMGPVFASAILRPLSEVTLRAPVFTTPTSPTEAKPPRFKSPILVSLRSPSMLEADSVPAIRFAPFKLMPPSPLNPLNPVA